MPQYDAGTNGAPWKDEEGPPEGKAENIRQRAEGYVPLSKAHKVAEWESIFDLDKRRRVAILLTVIHRRSSPEASEDSENAC
jgi:hypothetical protein